MTPLLDAGALEVPAVFSGYPAVVVEVEANDWIEAADYCVRLHVGSRPHLLRRPLTELEAELDPGRFVRIHRSTIVNVDRVRELRPQAKGEPWSSSSTAPSCASRVATAPPCWPPSAGDDPG